MRSIALSGLAWLLSAAAMAADPGTFAVYDAATHARIDAEDGVRVTSRASDEGGMRRIEGEIENLQPGDRGVILEYRIPVTGGDLQFWGGPGAPAAVAGGEIEENVYPLAALTSAGAGVAIAIPPTSPCEFGMVAVPGALAVRFYLGLSPETRRFPNRAPFSFLVYDVDPHWGFRSALSRYYERFPQFYSNRSGVDGQFLFLAEDGKEPSPSPQDLSRFGYTCVETQAPWLQDYLTRDRQAGILSLPYSIVGMREVKYLPLLPKTYDQAMQAYDHWTLADNAGHEITKENEAGGRDVRLKEQVESSYCETAAGKRIVTMRHTPWGLNSVTFTTNPNPDLFADQHRHNVGRDAIELIKRWRADHPEIDGVTIDSLGGNWPAHLNYRREQFRYVRYPLTCDATGRVAIHNEISHYEFLETLRRELRAGGNENRSYINANGIYAYAVRPDLPQHYRESTKAQRFWVGRFFLASQLDFAVSEPGVISADESLEFMRVAMGRKIYSPTNARFEDPVRVAQWVNRCLCFGLFAVNTRRYGDPIHYYFPEANRRDQALWDWFVPKIRLLSRAGWEPVTYARTDQPKIRLERYGHGDRVYLAALNEGASAQECVLTLDLDGLGFSRQDYPRRWTIDEIARAAPVRTVGPGKFAVRLQPYQTCILALRKS